MKCMFTGCSKDLKLKLRNLYNNFGDDAFDNKIIYYDEDSYYDINHFDF